MWMVLIWRWGALGSAALLHLPSRSEFGSAFSEFFSRTGRFASKRPKNLIAKLSRVKYLSLYEFAA
jgi:hypothetical protein